MRIISTIDNFEIRLW